jgi:hypothetical protein
MSESESSVQEVSVAAVVQEPAPVVQAPVVQAPVVQAPVVQAPVVQAPVVQAPVVQAPVVQAPVVQAPVVQAPVVQAPVVQAPVVQAPNDLRLELDQVQQVVDGISDLLNGRKLTEALLIRVIANCMVITAKMQIQNHIKKRVVIAAIEQYIKNKSGLPQEEIDILMTLVDVIVEDAIDTLADVRTGHINLSTKNCCTIQ